MLDFILTGNSEGRTLTIAFPDFSTRVFTEETPGFDSIVDVILDQTDDDFETADLIISIIADGDTDDPDFVCSNDCTCEENVDPVDNDTPSLKSIICDLAKMFESENSEEVDSSSKSADLSDTDTQPLFSRENIESDDDHEEPEGDNSTDDDRSHTVDSDSVPVDSLEDLLALLGINLVAEDSGSAGNDTSGSEPESHFCNRVCSDVMSNRHHESEEDNAESDQNDGGDNTYDTEADQQEKTPGGNDSPFADTINSVVLGRVIPVRIPVSQANFSGYTGPGPFMRI